MTTPDVIEQPEPPTAVRPSDLLACPFCGCKSPKATKSWLSGWDIECALCGVSPTANTLHESYEAARDVWNTRAR